MLRGLLVLGAAALAAGLSAAQLPEGFTLEDFEASPCSGAQDPKKKLPACYKGKASVLGGAFSESVVVTIRDYDFNRHNGTLDIDATGVSPESCSRLPFTKTGKDINMPGSEKCLSGTKVTAEYCSDQDAVQLHVSIPHFPVATIPVTLSPLACP